MPKEKSILSPAQKDFLAKRCESLIDQVEEQEINTLLFIDTSARPLALPIIKILRLRNLRQGVQVLFRDFGTAKRYLFAKYLFFIVLPKLKGSEKEQVQFFCEAVLSPLDYVDYSLSANEFEKLLGEYAPVEKLRSVWGSNMETDLKNLNKVLADNRTLVVDDVKSTGMTETLIRHLLSIEGGLDFSFYYFLDLLENNLAETESFIKQGMEVAVMPWSDYWQGSENSMQMVQKNSSSLVTTSINKRMNSSRGFAQESLSAQLKKVGKLREEMRNLIDQV